MSWFAPSELAGLPSMPTTRKCVKEKAEREDWECRDRIGRGGGKEYLVPDRYFTDEFLAQARSRFPDKFPAIKAEPVEVAILTHGEPKTAIITDLNIPTLPDKEEIRLGAIQPREISENVVAARNEILILLRRYLPECQATGNVKMFCLEVFAQKVRTGKIELNGATVTIPDWVLDSLRSSSGQVKISRSTLINWEKEDSLKPRHKGREGQSFFDQCPSAAIFCEAILKEYGSRATAGFILSCFQDLERIKVSGLEIEGSPSLSQINYWLSKFKDSNSALYKRYVTAEKNKTKPAFGSYSIGLLPNGKWEMDSTLIDVEISDNGKTKRWAVVQCVDVATRRRKFLLYPTSKSEAICLLVRDCIIDWGLPKAIKTDNGKDYTSHHLESFLRSLGIDHELCDPFTPQQKPHVERGYRLIQHHADFEKLPGNVGHNVIQRQEKRKRSEDVAWSVQMTSDQFSAWLSGFCQKINNSDSESLGMSPNQKLLQFVAEGWTKRVVSDLRELDWLLNVERERNVNAQGIKINNRLYIAPELGAMIGQKVSVRFDPTDPNEIWVYSSADLSQASFICKAVWDEQLSAEELAELAIKAKLASKAVDAHVNEVGKIGRKFKRKIEQNPEILLPNSSITPLVPIGERVDLGQAVRDAINSAVAPALPPTQDPAVVAREIAEMQPQVKKRQGKDDADFEKQALEVFALWKNGSDIPDADLQDVLRWWRYGTAPSVVLDFEIPNLQDRRDFVRWLNQRKLPDTAAM